MRNNSTKARGVLRGAAAVVLLVLACVLVAAPAGAQDDGYGAYVGSNTTVFLDEPEQTAVASARTATPPAGTGSAGALPEKLPFTGGDAAQVALFGGLLLVGGLAVLGWRRRAVTA